MSGGAAPDRLPELAGAATDAPQPLPPAIVSRETRARLDLFAETLRAWSRTVNLVARRDLPVLWPRHIADSLQLVPLLPAEGPIVDLGSGAGFPGLVLAIASGLQVHLVESDHRKAAFLREAARLTGANAVVHAARIETVQAALPASRLVTARALADLPQLLDWAAPLLAPNGACLFPKGARGADELTQAARRWHMRVVRWQSRTEASAVILHISELSRDAGPGR